MKEAQFLKHRAARWQMFETTLRTGKQTDPDELATFLIELTDDLSYARTFYPGSNTTSYLNNLTVMVHQRIYKRRRKERGRMFRFFAVDIPMEIYRARKEMYLSLFLFTFAMAIGVFSLANDEVFVEKLLGRGYMTETRSNIAEGNPMGIYEGNRINMFFRITINNIGVSLRVLITSVLTSVAAGLILLHNGILLGSFLYFFQTENLLGTASQAVWMHGTVEITAIVISGGAGILFGNAWLFPGTYTRMTSFIMKGKQAAIIIAGLIPFFVFAGFIESFVTRYYQNQLLSLGCILFSIVLIIWYFVYMPYKVSRHAESRT